MFGGEAFATFGEGDPGWFNYTGYEYNALRNVRLSLSTEVRPSTRLQVLAEVRLDHGQHLSAYALFARIRPWPDHRFDIQIGRVPPTFGALSRTVYAYDNALMETINGLYKTECIRTTVFHAGPYKTLADVEYATAGWVDWYNNRRLHGTLGMITPVEHEAAYYETLNREPQPV